MSRYVVAPYIIQTKSKGGRGAKARSLKDIDGQGLSFESFVCNVLNASSGKDVTFEDPKDPGKSFEITSLRIAKGQAVFMVIEPGRRGLESEIRGAGEPGFKRNSKHSEYIPLRHIVFFPENSHTAIVFAERFGRYGVITFLRTCFHSVFMRRLPTVTMDFDPLTTLSALKHATYKKLSFKAPRRKNPDGTLLDFAPTVGIQLDMKQQKKVKDLETTSGRIDAGKVFGVMRDEMRSSGLPAPVDSAGWSSSITVEMANGQERTFDIDNDGPALVYPLNGAEIDDTKVPMGVRPKDEIFIAVCNQILKEIEGQFEVTPETRLPKLSKYIDWNSSDYKLWEVDYFDSAEPDGDLTRAVHGE